MKAIINGRDVELKTEKTILELAEEMDIEIPTLCHHGGLEPYGACRLCIVEIEKNGRRELDTSCTRYVEDGMKIRTETEEIIEKRKVIAELLLARAPESKKLQKKLEDLGVTETEFTARDYDCVLYCGKCVRACKEEVGIGAINFVGRGYETEVDTPFSIDSDVCIGCGACAEVCPTGAIEVDDEGSTRYIRYFNTTLELKECRECGDFFSTERMIERLKAEEEFSSFAEEYFDLCEKCRRNKEMSKFLEVKQ
ncbi:2Fe-2S iron-sulfur cluster-binding protein [Acetohalobium arabaticum]|uniref:Ferredoxin n=1 Tax=Acetohalobium arabaticum (strain ATCC 49924 / DSM 5501 / Z-7288) TaxID=574087 RepID=D9QPS3_ACEAZ|nr:4Fe-4S dicluster domain-containing protein [Acetohalobium arabaticum]ADL12514.1 4Fe-4S ferredoxin iron-sulfur binding domain protein [Acetohalobium arabaticum DSM 5501]